MLVSVFLAGYTALIVQYFTLEENKSLDNKMTFLLQCILWELVMIICYFMG